MSRCALAMALWLAAAGSAAGAELPAVARSHLRTPVEKGVGNVFFLPAPGEPGAVAVGAAHSFDRTLLAESGEVEFRLADGARVSVSTRYFARPGRSFHEPGAGLRDDHLVFALGIPPRGVRLLEPADRIPRPEERVRILGPDSEAHAGRVVRADARSIDVDLPRVDLRGWGGAPVVEAEGGRVLGLLQTARPTADGLRAGVGPIGGALGAMARPYEGGLGRLFATQAPVASAATGHTERRRAATGSIFGDASPSRSAAEVIAAAGPRAAPPPLRRPDPLRLEIEHPPPETILGDAAGAFVAGRALGLRSEIRRIDIVIVIDTSSSTGQPAGVDVDGDGVVGVPVSAQPRGPLDLNSTDPGDSILAAEVAAARKLLAGLDPRTTRVGLVTFAGEPTERRPGVFGPSQVRLAAITEEPLTADTRRLHSALDAVGRREARGMTHMAAGIDQATLELLGLEGALSEARPDAEKIVLFFTDGTPTLPYQGVESVNVRATLRAAQRARYAGVRIHSFAIGPEALEGPISTVEMAAITEGLFTPVRDPGSLVQLVEDVSFADIEEVQVRNATSGAEAFQLRVHADGSWDSLVPLATGRNEIAVRARSSDGREAERSVVVHYAPGAASPYVPAELVLKRSELLEARLVELRYDRQEAERRRAEAARRELVLEIERERAAAVERAEAQRKELELELDDPAEP